MGITLRIGVHEMGMKTVDKMGIDGTGSHRFDVARAGKPFLHSQ